MIWVKGEVVPDDSLTISVADRTFEHGLGLFETFRTWNRRAPLLARHMARMERSAKVLGIPLERSEMPDDEAVSNLLSRGAFNGDAMLRVTLSGGLSEAGGSTLWMRAAPLPPPTRREGVVVDLGDWRVDRDPSLARHKSLNYWERRLAYDRAKSMGYDEVLSTIASREWLGNSRLGEGSRTNLFLVLGDSLLTPSLEAPIVPGVMRGLILELARMLPMDVREPYSVTRDELREADEVFLTNSVRGIIPVARADDRSWEAPGRWTQRLSVILADWLQQGGTAP